MLLLLACCEISLDQVISFTTCITLHNTAQITQSSILWHSMYDVNVSKPKKQPMLHTPSSLSTKDCWFVPSFSSETHEHQNVNVSSRLWRETICSSYQTPYEHKSLNESWECLSLVQTNASSHLAQGKEIVKALREALKQLSDWSGERNCWMPKLYHLTPVTGKTVVREQQLPN